MKKAVTFLGAAALLLMMTYTVANVIVRSVTGVPLPAAVELTTRWWMVPMVFAGWVIAHWAREHIIVDFVVDGARPRVRAVMAVVNAVILIFFLALLAYAGFAGALENQARGEYGIDTGWPVWITRYAVPFFALVFIGYVLSDGWRALTHRGRTAAAHDSTSSDVLAEGTAVETGATHDR